MSLQRIPYWNLIGTWYYEHIFFVYNLNLQLLVESSLSLWLEVTDDEAQLSSDLYEPLQILNQGLKLVWLWGRHDGDQILLQCGQPGL